MTGGPGIALELDIEVPLAEVQRYLGYRRERQPRANIAARLAELWPRALELVAPRGAFELVDSQAATGFGMADTGASVAVGLCTIGVALEVEAQRCIDRGDLLDGVLYDGFGSAAAEATADALNEVVCAHEAVRELHAARRVSPGYGGWDVKWQADLIGLLPAAELGITLTPGMMMVPRKSVSFAVALRNDCDASAGAGDSCASCALENCQFRDPTD